MEDCQHLQPTKGILLVYDVHTIASCFLQSRGFGAFVFSSRANWSWCLRIWKKSRNSLAHHESWTSRVSFACKQYRQYSMGVSFCAFFSVYRLCLLTDWHCQDRRQSPATQNACCQVQSPLRSCCSVQCGNPWTESYGKMVRFIWMMRVQPLKSTSKMYFFGFGCSTSVLLNTGVFVLQVEALQARFATESVGIPCKG